MAEKKINAFQGLRGYAIILIFLSHCTFSLNSYGHSTTMWLGGLGVSLFIMLSGYLLVLQNNQNTGLIPFDTLKRRIKRFYPLHLVTLIISLPFSISAFMHGGIMKQFVKLLFNVTLMQSWIPLSSVYYSFNAVSWYLSLTVFFIIVGPFTLKLINKIQTKWLIGILAIGLLFEVMYCFLVKDLSIVHWLVYILPVVRYVDYFAGGVLCAIVKNHKTVMAYNITWMIVATSIMTGAIIILSIDTNSEFFSTAIWFVPSILTIVSISFGEQESKIIKTVFSNKAITFMGNISFEFFLIHQLVIRYIKVLSNKLIQYDGFIIYIFAFIIAFFASCFWNSISRRGFRLKRGG